MTLITFFAAVAAVALCLASCNTSAATTAHSDVISLTFRGKVTPKAAELVEKAMAQIVAKKPKAILMIIDSSGGELDAGWKIEKMIESSPIPVHCIVDGQAMSMAFVMLQGCTTRGMTPRSVLVAHQPFISIDPSSDGDKIILLRLNDLRTMESDLAADVEKMAIFESGRMHMPLADFEDKVDGKDWTMAAATALRNHAVDYISTVDQARTKLEAGSISAP